MAAVRGDLGEHVEARKQIEQALESDLRQFGPDHPNVAVRRSEFSKALAEIDLVLEVFRRKLPAGHPHIRGAEEWRGGILKALGR